MFVDSHDDGIGHHHRQHHSHHHFQPPPSTSETSTIIHDPLFELILNHHSASVTGIGNDNDTNSSTTSDSSSSSSFFLLANQHANKSDLNLLIPLVSSSPSFFDVSENGENPNIIRSVPILVLLTSLLIFIILATIIGNVFVISAVILERSLRTVGNYLVVSLAITDLLVACLVMPVGAIYEVTGEWRLGIKLCELWTFTDVLCCTTSIFHLLAIACDRLWAVTNVDYIHRRKTKHVCIGIAVIWLFSTIISLGPILGWKDAEFEQRIVDRKECMISQDISYQIFATIASFYAPSILLLLQYYRIYQVAKTRLKLKKQRYQHRIRRRPSFYRARKDSELKEFPRVTHRVSINPNEEFFSSSAVPPPSSTSGVYSSSTTTDYTTATTNTTLSTDRASSIVSLSPPAGVMLKPMDNNNTLSANAHQNKHQTSSPSPSSTLSLGKRFSIVQFFTPNQHRKSNLDGEKFTMSNFDDYDHNDLRSNETSIDESTIIVAGTASNIVVYVDDYGSTICSSCDAAEDGSGGHGAMSYYQNTDYLPEDEFIDSPIDDVAVDVTDPNDIDSVIDEEISIKQSESPLENIRKMSLKDIIGSTNQDSNDNNNNRNFLSPPPPLDVSAAENQEPIVISVDPHQRRRESCMAGSGHHHYHKKQKHRRIKKLKFRNKILRFDGNNKDREKEKQDSKAAKTLTIITGVFIICWLPFFVLALVMPLCGHKCYINKYAFDFFIWLGWANSTLNPFLYTIFSPDFRNAFKKLLKRIKKS